jgi:hypothetical protein
MILTVDVGGGVDLTASQYSTGHTLSGMSVVVKTGVPENIKDK